MKLETISNFVKKAFVVEEKKKALNTEGQFEEYTRLAKIQGYREAILITELVTAALAIGVVVLFGT